MVFSTSSLTTLAQSNTEDSVLEHLNQFDPEKHRDTVKLLRKEHAEYVELGLKGLPSYFGVLDASQPWLLYWMTHSLDLLGRRDIIDRYQEKIIAKLKALQNESGGWGGGGEQLSHLAPTYAAVNTLMILGTEKAYQLINRRKLYEFLLAMKDKNTGGMRMHDDGEIDVRACYCALSVASLTNILTPELVTGIPEYIVACQTYEGGIGAFPGCEAHGGYAFCGLASLVFLNKSHVIDIDKFAHWAAMRQMDVEGGFQGRTHKLVDACYSFWVGGNFPLVSAIFLSRQPEITEQDTKIYDYLQYRPPSFSKQTLKKQFQFESLDNSIKSSSSKQFLFNSENLQKYILLCCQKNNGGLIDKPGKQRDFYHTAYALSGLSLAQHCPEKNILGIQENELEEINPLYNLVRQRVENGKEYFAKLSPIEGNKE